MLEEIKNYCVKFLITFVFCGIVAFGLSLVHLFHFGGEAIGVCILLGCFIVAVDFLADTFPLDK
jgi:hypothetical protein